MARISRRAGIGLALAAGFAGTAWAQADGSRFDGQYTGRLALTRVIDGDCTEPPLGALYPLTVAGGAVSFVYTPRFDTILRGRVDRNGTFRASARTRRGTVQMTGSIQGGGIVAQIRSPSCHYTFQTAN